MKLNSSCYSHFFKAQELAYKPYELKYESVAVEEREGQAYGACTFILNNKIVKFRVAKITPTKNGQFVTIWKRMGSGPIIPYDMVDQFDLLVVSVCKELYFGQFIFPKDVLSSKGFISQDGKGGKRAMRVYPPWDIVNNPQAKKTQTWQLLYFVEIQPTVNSSQLKKLFL